MNYRHAFHAGNFADVFKHAILARILVYLTRKDAPIRFIDTHAGVGLYDLLGAQGRQNPEWQAGIARCRDPWPEDVAALLAPYLATVGALDSEGATHAYPGSPVIAQMLTRPQDRLNFCEKHPADRALLQENIGHDARIRVLDGDGYTRLNALVPPRERRGLVLIDPPFEAPDEFTQMQQAVVKAHHKWAQATYVLWYPVKDQNAERLAMSLVAAGIRRILRLQINIGALGDGKLTQCALLMINPPYVLEQEARVMLPALCERLAQGPNSSFSIDWLAGE
ncbi:MAG: 23S rRNA (adenine(2030)-N(6))-methyltransferase RlmJ [Hyphomicrobiales bacterium]|nr:23S rRNA (adenine(2030)-N(6))-methyltransferase RlmJ [Hyphomicrobiales bacterium]MDE2113619.1 23S rRNA (adenine(2030)-N(6))-methyltransferase RlmJ [Hyphomicrobiales bacterium]